MAKLPESTQPTKDAILKHYESNQEDSRRAHLGGSLINDDCERKLWYIFRWTKRIYHNGRLLMLFSRGHEEEPRLINHLRKAGITVFEIDNETGEQFEYSACGGHFGCSLDGVAKGILEAPKTPHLLEFKTHNDKSFKELTDKGVEKAKPLHFGQMQAYMYLSGLTRAFYMAVNKNDDSIYTERLKIDKLFGKKLLERALRVITADRPPERMTNKPDFYKCKFCDYQDQCHYDQVSEVNCRTCVHSTAEVDGQARWSCALYSIDISEENQRRGCESHLFIPDLIPYAKQLDSGIDELTGAMWIKYQYNDQVFINSSGFKTMNDIPCYSSKELSAMDKNALDNGKGQDLLRQAFDALMVES
jgi:hypothetical protein